MTNHVHLVVDPGDKPETLSLLMKRVAGRHTRYINRLEKRTGSLWDGHYIELNPLRAGMVTDPAEYRWSSYACKTTGTKDHVVDYSPSYLSMADTASERQDAYAEYVLDTIPEYEITLIREALQRGQLTGSARFLEELSERLGIRLSNRRPGRPKKDNK